MKITSKVTDREATCSLCRGRIKPGEEKIYIDIGVSPMGSRRVHRNCLLKAIGYEVSNPVGWSPL